MYRLTCVFLLFAFISIFDFADVLFEILQKRSLEVQFSLARIAGFCQILEGECGKIDAIYERTVEAVGHPSTARGRTDSDALQTAIHGANRQHHLANQEMI